MLTTKAIFKHRRAAVAAPAAHRSSQDGKPPFTYLYFLSWFVLDATADKCETLTDTSAAPCIKNSNASQGKGYLITLLIHVQPETQSIIYVHLPLLLWYLLFPLASSSRLFRSNKTVTRQYCPSLNLGCCVDCDFWQGGRSEEDDDEDFTCQFVIFICRWLQLVLFRREFMPNNRLFVCFLLLCHTCICSV